MEIVVKSDRGQKRAVNEDYANYFYNQSGIVLLITCDGIGGHNAGDVASAMTVCELGNAWQETDFTNLEDIHLWLRKSIIAVNQSIYLKAKKNEELIGMGTTLVAAVVVEENVLVAYVGDSRVYLQHNHTLNLLTEDHSLVNELVKSGEITAEEALVHPKRNYVTRSVGVMDSVEVDFVRSTMKQGDCLLLCTDGLTNMISVDTIEELLSSQLSIEEIADTAVGLANAAGGTDNITILLAKKQINEGCEN
ncbi:protein phosphatase [Granulicatella balaenopterae]|uniref:protein-serine/threonine phosphatase n=1 Tax=Granulicatella balaenopterae TaxID=137733 RepID=A0A1H9KSK0_9LACT|nr:Stp1/IreP family PP2C-type Ser/Thr phosphatase [Granulicatella balaenopterae]SER02019.1 protein phosphatase [Granulicatella balaenopterae]